MILDTTLNQLYSSPTLFGLQASNDGPTMLGPSTNLSATLSSGVGSIQYSWDFDNGQNGTGADVAHTYAAVGVYQAVVTVSNPVDAFTDTTTVIITDIPVTNLVASNDSPTLLGQATAFSATAQGSNVSYTWDFGDGQNASGANVSHTYTASGTYTAKVTAANSTNSLIGSTIVTINELKTAPGFRSVRPRGVVWTAFWFRRILLGWMLAHIRRRLRSPMGSRQIARRPLLWF